MRKQKTAITLLFFVITLSACSVGPRYVTPEVALPERFLQAQSDAYSSSAEPSKLWASFDEPALHELLQRALQKNYSLAQGLATVNETRALRGLELYSWLPTVTASASGQRNSQSTADPFSFPGQGITDVYQAGFDSTWEIDLFGSLRRQSQTIRRRVEADEAALHAIRLSVIAEVAQSYFALRGNQRRLMVQQRSLHNQQRSLAILEQSLEAGRGTAFDVARSRSLERLIAARLPATEAAIVRNEQRLSVLTAQPASEIRKKVGPFRQPTKMPKLVAIGTPQAWLSRRPDVLAAERRLAAATSEVGVEVAEFFPKLTLNGSFGWTSQNEEQLGDSIAERWRFGPSLSWRFLDVGRVRQRVLAAKARNAGLLAAFEETVGRALEETENALENYRAATATYAALTDAWKAAIEATQLAQLRFENGASDYFAVLDSERTIIEIEDQWIIAETSRATAIAALYKALGGDFATDGQLASEE